MGATPNYGFPWPELSAQADGPDGFQDLAARVEQQMSTFRTSREMSGYSGGYVERGTETIITSQDYAADVVGWAWLDVDVSIGIGGPYSQGFAAPSNTAGTVRIQQGATVLRSLRWHSNARTELLLVHGAVGLAVPLATTLIQVRLVVQCDGTSGFGCTAFEVNMGLTQFGALRGV